MTGPLVASLSRQQRRADALLVAAVEQLAVELVDQVAAVGEDQDAAGARGLDEAHGRDGLAGAGGVLEPEAAGRVGVLGLGDGVGGRLLLELLGLVPVERLLVLVDLLVALDLDLVGGQLLDGLRRGGAASRCCEAWISAVSAISVPDRASTWWGLSTVPSARCGSSSFSSRSRPSRSEYSRRHSTEG